MKWKAPNSRSPILTLAKLEITPKTNWENTQENSVPISISLSENEQWAWATSPTNNHDQNECAKRVYFVGESLAKLAKKGQANVQSTAKEHPLDLVTELDQGIEMLFRLWLNHHYPHHKIIGEEGFKEQVTPNDIVWFLDPIDGTTNYVNQHNDVTLHLGSMYQGKPFINYVGLPIKDTSYSTYKAHPLPIPPSNTFSIGTEYLPHRPYEKKLYKKIVTTFNASEHMKKSIGINTLALLEGKISIFYKNFVKLWDVLAPLGIIEQYCPNQFISKIYVPHLPPFYPFSNHPHYINRLNIKHNQNSRIGHIVIAHKSVQKIADDLIQVILKEINDKTSASFS